MSKTRTRRLVAIAATILLAMLLVGAAGSGVLYVRALDRQMILLADIANSQAALVEAVATYDRGRLDPSASAQATLSQVRAGLKGFSAGLRSAEIVVGTRQGNAVALLAVTGDRSGEEPLSTLVWNDGHAEPLRRALAGDRGTMIGLDYTGAEVMAAFVPLPSLNAGLAVKIDAEEFRAPFIQAIWVSGAVGLPLIILSVFVVWRVGGYMAGRVDASESRMRSVFNSVAEGLLTFDRAGICTGFNPAAAEILARGDGDRFLGRAVDDLTGHHASGEASSVVGCATDGRSIRGNEGHWFRRADGTSFPVLFRAEALIEQAEIVGGVISFSDMTEVREAQEALRREAEMSHQLAHLGRQLLAPVRDVAIADLVVEAVRAIYPDRPLRVFRLDENGQVIRAAGSAEPTEGETIVAVAPEGGAPLIRVEMSVPDLSDVETPRVFLARVASLAGLALLLRETQSRLRGSEARYRAVIEDHAEPLCRYRPDGTLTFVNEAYGRYFDRAPESLIGENFLQFVPEEDKAVLAEIVAAIAPESPVYISEHRVVGRGGVIRWQQWIDHGLFDDEGRLVEIQGGGRDVTERREAEELLKRRESILKVLNEQAGLFLQRGDWHAVLPRALDLLGPAIDVTRIYLYAFILSADKSAEVVRLTGMAEWCSPGVRSLIHDESFKDLPLGEAALGDTLVRLRRGEMLALTPADLPAPLGPLLTEEEVKSLLVVPVLVEGELWGILGFDETRFARVWSDASRDALGMIVRVLGAAITRARTEAALSSREGRLRALVESIPDSVLEVSPLGEVISCNERSEVIFGRSSLRVVGQDLPSLFSEADVVRDLLEQAARSGRPRAAQASVARQGEEGTVSVPVELSVGAWGGESRPHFSVAVRDITARIEAEGRLRQAQKAEALGNLASGVAHDFNNMLMPILALSDMVRQDPSIGEVNRDRLDHVVDAAERASILVKRILAYARDYQPAREPVALDLLLEDVLALLAAVIPSTVTLSTAVEKVGWILGDKSGLQAVLLNLASNAADAMDGGVGTLRIELSAIGEADLAAQAPTLPRDRTWARIRLRDNGVGMDATVLVRIFDPFFTTKEVGRGTGLGLSMAQDIATKHGGQIVASSRLGEGSVFDVYLPLLDQEDGVDDSSGGVPDEVV